MPELDIRNGIPAPPLLSWMKLRLASERDRFYGGAWRDVLAEIHVILGKIDPKVEPGLGPEYQPMKKSSQTRWRVGAEGPSSGACKGNVDCIAKRYRERSQSADAAPQRSCPPSAR